MTLPATVYRTDGDWGTGKGSNLTPSEFDTNLWVINERLGTLEGSGVTPGVGIVSAVLTGDQLVFHLSSGGDLGPFTLPTPNLNPTGAWAATTGYALNDVLYHVGTTTVDLFLVGYPHTSASTFDPAATSGGHALYLKLMSVAIPALPPVTSGLETVFGLHANYTAAYADLSNVSYLQAYTSSAYNLTLPKFADSPFPIGSQITLAQISTGVCTVVAGSGATVNHVSGAAMTTKPFQPIVLKKSDTDTWDMLGDYN